jgi:hypothetical protein
LADQIDGRNKEKEEEKKAAKTKLVRDAHDEVACPLAQQHAGEVRA